MREVEAWLGAGDRWVRGARAWAGELLDVQRDLGATARSAGEESRAALFVRGETLGPAEFAARVGDVARSSWFLWTEAGFAAQARLDRAVRGEGASPLSAAWLPRASLLVTVAADLYTGYAALRDRARWWPELVRPSDWELQHRRGAARALDTAETLGGLLIKAGQFASARPDLLPVAYVEQLATLQDRVPPRPWPAIRSAIARALGSAPERVFDPLDSRPLAAASLAQVHRARLRDGRTVAVKVQYPDAAGLVRSDLAVLRRIVQTVARLEPAVQLRPIVDYLQETLPLELDFRREAAAATHLRAALAHRRDVVIPAVVDELTRERLLVMELVDGIRITDRAAMQDAGIDRSSVAKLVNDVYAEQVFRHGLLHGDPHPGNLLVQAGPRLVILDHGLTTALSPSLVDALRAMLRALEGGDLDALAAALPRAGFPSVEQVDVSTLLELAGILAGGEPARDAAGLARRVGVSIGTLPVGLILVGRALTILDGITRQLDPDLDVAGVIARHASAP